MSLLDRLRKAKQRGRNAAREKMERARLSLEEAQSIMRRKMRIHPRTRRTHEAVRMQNPQDVKRVEAEEKSATSAAPESALGHQSAPEQPALESRRPIVSVNGKDVAPEDLDRAKSDPDRPKDVKKTAA